MKIIILSIIELYRMTCGNCSQTMWVKASDIIDYFGFPKDKMNKLRKKYPKKYEDDDEFEVDYEWVENDRSCFNSIKISWDTEEVKFVNTIEYNTSSPMALWLCTVLPDCEDCDEE